MTDPRTTAPATDLDLAEAGALAPLVTPQEAERRIEQGAAVIDVRSDAGRTKDGLLPGASIVDRYALDGSFDPASPDSLVTGTDHPVVVICGSVRGSGPVAAELIRRGFSNVVHVDGGFPGWRDAGLPVIAPAAS